MNDENFINIQGWMINRLNLRGNELILYAIIYGFSQDGKTKYRGSLSYIQKAMRISRNSVILNLKKLIEKKLIEKEKKNNGNKYSIISSAISGSAETAPLEKKKKNASAETELIASAETELIASAETEHNNNNNNNISSKEDREKISQAPPQKKIYGNEKINKVLEFFKKTLEVEDFKETKKMQRIFGKHLFNLKEKIGAKEFLKRFEFLQNDEFHLQNCGSLKYLYKNIKSYVPPKKTFNKIKKNDLKKDREEEKKQEKEKAENAILDNKIARFIADIKNIETIKICKKKSLERFNKYFSKSKLSEKTIIKTQERYLKEEIKKVLPQ